MSALDHDSAVYVAETLSRAARQVRTIKGLRAKQHVSVEWHGGGTADPLEITVHGCEPSELLDHVAAYPGCDDHYDSDGILRWVEVQLDGIPCTFFRR